MSEESRSAWTTAVDAWRRLWSVGANGENISNTKTTNTTKRKQHKTTKRRSKVTPITNQPRPNHTNTSYIQSDLYGHRQETDDGEEYGDTMQAKTDSTLRIMFHNINCLPESAATEKSHKLVSTITNKQIDIALLAEVGLYWKVIDSKNKWYERIRRAAQSQKTELAFNTTEPDRTAARQFGGVAAIAIDDVSHRVIDQGQDGTGLGRWAWLLLEGRQGHHLRVVSVYRPVESIGPDTVSAQHRRHLFTLHRDEEPRDAIYSDLFNEVQAWKEKGNHIILGIDANEDVRTGNTLETFRSLGMKDLILGTHGKKSPPATCAKNRNRQPIDAIFATAGIKLVAGGYAPFNVGCPSDHRFLWVDISFYDAFGHAAPPLVPPDIRRLNTGNPKLVHKYNEQVNSAMAKEGLASALFNLELTAKKEGWNQELEAEYNRINNRQYEIRKKIETKIRNIRAGAIPWTPKLQTFRTAIEIWSLILKKRKGIKISIRKLRRKLKKSNLQNVFTKTIPELEDALSNAFTQYKKAKEDAEVWRDEFMDALAASRAEVKGTTKENELKQLMTIDRQRTVARNIKRMQRKLQRNATIQIYVNDEDGRRLVTDKNDIEDACIAENDSRFSQSEGTPPMIEPLLTDLGYLADTPEAAAILEGSYIPPPETDKYAILFLQELRMPENVRNNPMSDVEVTPERNKAAWSKQKEAVSSEPAGLTFSHYKAGAQDAAINRFDALLRCLPYKYGFSPQHWQEITDVEILKKAGVYDIDKMRTITLMDAAYNMNNKQLGKDLLSHAEKLGNLAREQYGSRKNHQACTAATNKVLTMDLLRLRRQAGALCSNDAKSCYDRIVHSVAALSMLRQGAPKGAVNSLLLTLQRAKHKIRTGFGVSAKHYGSLRWPPLQGLGQGNGVAPTGWAVISTVLIHMMRTALFGLQITTCLSAVLISFLCYAFVDDTDLVHTGPTVDTPGADILKDMQRFVTHWEGGLRATGGALRVDKSYWYLIDFKWKNDDWQYTSIEDIPGNITVRDADGQIKILPRLEPHDANETLGIFIAMDGNPKKQVEKLRGKAEEFAEHVRTGFLTREEAWHALNSTIVKTLEYPMEAISLTKDQWDYIMAPILKSVLPRSGIVRTFPRDVLYAPDEFTGMGLMHPYYKQYLKHLELALKETIKPTITANLLTAAMEQLRLESGLPRANGEWHLSDTALCLTPCWIKDLLLFCDDNEITIQDTCADLDYGSTDDIYLMEAFRESGFTPKELKILNQCRLFLRVLTLSDICTMDLKRITLDSYNGNPQRRRPQCGWPRAPPQLSSTHWNLWKKAITKCFLRTGTTQREIRHNLGNWLPGIRETWEWFWSPSDNRLYHRQGFYYRVYSKIPSTSRLVGARFQPVPQESLRYNILPDDVLMTTIATMANSIVMVTGSANLPPRSAVTPLTYHDKSIDEILNLVPEDDTWAVDIFHSPDECMDLAMGIIKGNATAVSDGSFKDHMGTSGFVLRGSNKEIVSTGANTVPGNPNEQSSYRSELAGISGTLAILDATCKKYDISTGSVTVALDGQQALLKARSLWPLSPTDPDFDLLTDIRRKISKLPITLNWHWIEGHQDKYTPFHRLTRLAQDNVIADGIAKDQWNKMARAGHIPTPQRFGDEGWSISIAGNKVSHLDFASLYKRMWTDTALEYWANKHNITYEEIITIDWDACGEAIHSLSFSRRRRLVKHASGHFGIGKKMLQWKLQEHDECPLCRQRETADHVLRCKDERAKLTWKLSLQKLDTWMTSRHTNPDIRTAIISRLQAWHDYQPIPSPPWNCTFKDALNSQNSIGWYPFLLGHISNHWKGVQHSYYLWLGRQNTGKQWVKLLIIQLFNVSWDMWEHRNAIKHNTMTPAKCREIAALDTSIREEYEMGDTNLLPRDRAWLSKPLSTLLQDYDLTQKKQWLTSVEQARVRWSRRRELTRHSQNTSRTILRNWLLLPNPTPNSAPT